MQLLRRVIEKKKWKAHNKDKMELTEGESEIYIKKLYHK